MVGVDISSFGADDLAIGWRSGNASKALGENAFDVMVGRAPFTLGNGMLLWDGAAEGGSRGGYWTNARKAFEMAAIGRFQTGRHKVEGFYLDKDDLPEANTGTRLWGANYEYALGEHTTLGASYLKFYAYKYQKPQRDGLNPPAIVREATDAYLGDEDAIARWIADRCIVDVNAFGESKRLWPSWQRWELAGISRRSWTCTPTPTIR
jgi:hypothetical protein